MALSYSKCVQSSIVWDVYSEFMVKSAPLARVTCKGLVCTNQDWTEVQFWSENQHESVLLIFVDSTRLLRDKFSRCPRCCFPYMALSSIYGADRHQFRIHPSGLYFDPEHSISLNSRFADIAGRSTLASLHKYNWYICWSFTLANVLAAVCLPSPVGLLKFWVVTTQHTRKPYISQMQRISITRLKVLF